MGHSTLNMTKHYCAIFDADITKNFDSLSPLAQLKGGEHKIKMGGVTMWDLPDLPLALVMEEILEWEKKPGQEKDAERETNTSDKEN